MSGKPDDARNGKSKKNGAEHRQCAIEILDYLNETAGRSFQHTDTNLGFIIARLKAGATPDQCRAVIDQQVAAWAGDPKMAPYLRPQTLFNREKFDAYTGLLGADLPKSDQSRARDEGPKVRYLT